MSPPLRLMKLSWLTAHRMLRREKDPTWELLAELFTSSASSFVCPECDHQGLVARPASEGEDDAWGMARTCQTCGSPITPERLEIFPETQVCSECKRNEEQGATDDEISFCPRCGAAMTLKTTRGTGITRYEYRCPECRR